MFCRLLLLLLALCFSTTRSSAQLMPLEPYSVFLLGNFSQVKHVLQYTGTIGPMLDNCDSDWTLVLNGDLVDNSVNFQVATTRIDSFLSFLSGKERGQVVIVPGEGDWADGGRQGLERVRLLQEFVKEKNYDRVYFPLRKGCPGPVLFPVREDIKLLTINTQWQNHRYTKPTSESAECDLADEASILEEVEDYIEDHSDGNLMVVGHHPVLSNGRYGGSFPVTDWLLPVPGISFFLTSFKQNIGTPVHLVNAYFDEFRQDLRALMSDQFSLIYAAGHESNLEVIRDYENVFINSGAPLHGGYVRNTKATVFSSKKPGLIGVRYYPDGRVESLAYQLKDGDYVEVDRATLFQAPCLLPEPDIPVNKRLVPCVIEGETPTMSSLAHPERITITANPNYKGKKSTIKWLGQHYRDSWTTPIEADVLDLDSFAGGLTPLEIGGGRQTLSLKFSARDSLEYVFRSVDKDPSKALSRDLRTTIISLLLRDQTTTQQPYGALTASHLLDKIDILHAKPRLFAMPNDEKLGPFGSTFGGMLGMIEERPTDPKDGKSFADTDDVKRTLNLFRRMFQDRDNTIDVPEFVRARVFDMLVGDWGKHEDNWKWAGYRHAGGVHYRPIPRDRDHVFSRWDGILPWLADREWAKPSGEDFGYKIKGLRSLMWQARHMDRFVAAEADRDQWLTAAQAIQRQISDADITEAVAKMPPEVVASDGVEIEKKLIRRKADLEEYADRYYRILAKEVDVVGSNKHELFEVDRQADGDVQVRMFKIRKGIKNELFYERLFKPSETREIRLFGLDGDDRFLVRGDAKKSILLRIVPGEGLNYISDSSRVKGLSRRTLLYRSTGDNVKALGELRTMQSADPAAYQYRRTAFAYNTYFPLVYLGFSSDYGFSVNGGVTFTNQRYGKPDFSSIHKLGVGLSTIGNVQFNYDGNWRHVLGVLDLIAGASVEKRRRYRYFFGYGNETTFDPDLLQDDFYTLQYTSAQAYVGLQRSFWKHSYLNFRFNYEINSRQTLENNILEEIDLLGEDRLNIGKWVLELDFDFRDRKSLPERGARFHMEHRLGMLSTERAKTYLTGVFSGEYFATAMPFTLGVRGGVMYSHNEVPYYDLPTVGQNRYLRGFRRNRFTGTTGVYLNSDLRLQLADRMGALIPHKFGLRFFYDQAQVRIKEEKSNKWHAGYGAGFYFVPLREAYSLHLSLAFSSEESALVLFGFGSSF